MVIRFEPFREDDQSTEQVEQDPRRPSASIPMDAVRSADTVMIEFDLPGVDPEAIDLTVERDVLTVSAARRFEPAEGSDEVLVNERPQGTSTRRIILSESLDTDRIEASYAEGVLSITIPVAASGPPGYGSPRHPGKRVVEPSRKPAPPQETDT